MIGKGPPTVADCDEYFGPGSRRCQEMAGRQAQIKHRVKDGVLLSTDEVRGTVTIDDMPNHARDAQDH